MAAMVALGWDVAAMPFLAMTTERPVFWKSLMHLPREDVVRWGGQAAAGVIQRRAIGLRCRGWHDCGGIE
ncbi:hypothetical protein D3C78_1586350 [compost metagenome]